MKLDRFDRQILEVLQVDGRINNQDLADRIGLSASPCLRRVRGLPGAARCAQIRLDADGADSYFHGQAHARTFCQF